MVKRTDRRWLLGAASSLCLAMFGASAPAMAKGDKAKDDAKADAKADDAKADDAKPKEEARPRKKATGPIDELVEKYRQARTPKGDNPALVVLSEGDCRSFAKDFVKAGEKEKGREADGMFNAGVVLDQCGLDKDAESMYKSALSKNPRFQPAMNNIGVQLQKAGQTQAAASQFENAIKANPSSLQAVQAYNNKAALLFDKAKQSGNKAGVDEAIGSVRRALALDAESMAAYQLLAQIYFFTAESDRSKLQLAQLVCDEAKKIDGNYAPIYNTLGLIKLRRNDKTGALTEFRKAAAIDPSLYEAQLNIAAISLSSRNYKQAEDAFGAVLKKIPNHMDATLGMGVALRGERKIDEAENWYKKAQQLDAKNCSVLYNMGLLYQDYKSGSTDEMNKSKDFYNKYISCERGDKDHVDEAKRRIKDIDDTFKALEESKKLEAELKAQSAEMEKMQKQQEEQMRKYEEEQKKNGGGAAPPAGGAAPAPAPAGGAPPPPPAAGAAPAPGAK